MGQFTTGVLNSLSPWNDANGAWANLNTALAAMFEPVAQIVMEQGTPDGPMVGVLSSSLSTSAAITSIPVGSLLETVPSGTLVMIVAPGGVQWQNFTTSSAAAKGAASIPVTSQTPGYAYPQGSFVALGFSSGWADLLDPDTCPTAYLPYLAQFVGVVVPPNTPDAQARQIIKAEAGQSRGTLASIQSAVERAQATPDKTRYAIQERIGLVGPDAYHFLISVDFNSLATQGDPTQLTANVTAVKPAGLQFTVVPFNAPLLSQYTRTLAAVTISLAAAQLSDVT